MNTASNSALTPGMILLCVGVVAILLVPAFLRSRLNTKIDIPPEERAKPVSAMQLARYALAGVIVLFWAMDAAHVYHAPPLAHWVVILIFLATMPFGRKAKPPAVTPPGPDQPPA